MRFLFFIVILLLSGCSTSSRLAYKTEHIAGDDFYTALASGYNQLAEREKKEYDFRDADDFATKGLYALDHQYMLPENPADREILDRFTLEELIIARGKMLQIFAGNTKFDFPLKSARLQILYDYWVEQAEENWQHQDIRRYRTEFWDTYKALEAAKKLAKRQFKQIGKDNYYTIVFDHDKKNIDKAADEILNQIAYYLVEIDDYVIILEGHADLSGRENYNRNLSKARIYAVKYSLIKKGVPQQVFIQEEVYGESKPKLTKSAGGYRDRLNRRVEIYIIPRKLRR